MRSSRSIAVVGLLFVVAACQETSNPTGPEVSRLRTAAPAEPVPGQYIVVFNDAVADPRGLARTLVTAHGGALRHAYASALKGFAARLPDAAVVALRHDPNVAYVDRKSTRLNSSHLVISYAVFCLKKKKNNKPHQR